MPYASRRVPRRSSSPPRRTLPARRRGRVGSTGSFSSSSLLPLNVQDLDAEGHASGLSQPRAGHGCRGPTSALQPSLPRASPLDITFVTHRDDVNKKLSPSQTIHPDTPFVKWIH